MRLLQLRTIFFALCSIPVLGDDAKIFVHFDKNFYLAGETMHYKAYVPGISRTVLHYQIAGLNKEILTVGSFLTNDGVGHGAFILPSEWKSGNYTITFFAYNSKIEAVPLVTCSVPVYNTLEVPKAIFKIISPIISYDSSQIQVISEKNVFSAREKITLRVKAVDMSNMSISVKEKSCLEIQNYIPPYYFKTSNSILDDNDLHFRGKITSLEGMPIANKSFALILIEQRRQYWLETNENGEFEIDLFPFSGSLNVQVMDVDTNSMFKVQFYNIATPKLDSVVLNETRTAEIIPEKLKEYIDLFRKRMVIDKIFNKDSVIQNLVNSENNALKADQVFKISNYITFNSFEDFLKEANTSIKVRKSKFGNTIRMFNTEARILFSQAPIIIIDGIYSRDIDAFLRLDIDDIEKIETFDKGSSLRKNFGTIGSNGVVVVTTLSKTTKPKESSSIFQLKGLTPELKKYFNSEEDVPALSPVVYWNHSISISSEEPTYLSFQHNDLSGEFVIEIMGLSKNGSIVRSTSTYSVED